MEEKPWVIHTKQKTKIHSHEPKKAAIKGSNTNTVNRSPKIKAVVVNKKSNNNLNGIPEIRKKKDKKTYLKSTERGKDNVREYGVGKLRKNINEANQSIKLKQTNLYIAGRTGVIGAKAVTDQMEGGKEVQHAAFISHEVFRPVIGTAFQGARVFKKQVFEQKNRRIKKVEAGKKLAKKSVNKSTKDAVKRSVKKVTKETAKKASKVTIKAATTATTTIAGSVGGPTGMAIGMAAGYTSGVAIERKDTHMVNRNRKLAFFLDKMNAQDNQQDSVVKLMKDLITRRVLLWIKAVAPMIGLVLLLLVLIVAMITLPVIAVVAVIYNSPFALFLPPLEAGDTVQTISSAYVAEFNREVNTLANDHTGYDQGQIIYVNYEGMDATQSNYYDILAVYMVKYGIGDTATIMNDTSEEWLRSVVDDMCSYTTSTGSETETITNEDGTTSTTTTTYLYVNVALKSYQDMISEYGFDSDQIEMLEGIMSSEYLSW